MAVIAFPLATSERRVARPETSPSRRPEYLRVVRELDVDELLVGAPRPTRTVTVLSTTPPSRQVRADAPALVRRLIATVALIGAALVLWFGLGALQGLRATAPPALVGVHRVAGGYAYVVRPGDTIWSIASAIDPSGDPRPIVDRLVAELHSSDVYPGEHLVVPS